jgi:hypothetical protein
MNDLSMKTKNKFRRVLVGAGVIHLEAEALEVDMERVSR